MLKPIKKIQFKFIFIFLCSLMTHIYSQDSMHQLQLSSNPMNGDYWWLNSNNNGKSISNLGVDYVWKLNKGKTLYHLNLSNNYKENSYLFSSSYYIIDKITTKKDYYFGESFIKHSFSNQTFLRIGKYYRDFSLYLNDSLSSGSMLVSKNAQPMPKLGIVSSYNLKKRKNITFELGIAHGIFDKNNYYTKKAPFLHEKFFYMHSKKNNHQFSVGFVHEAIWGGATEEYGNFPSSFEDFLKVIISADGEYEEGPHANALGNHLGIWDFSYQKTTQAKKLKLYYQHFFEDTSSLRFANSFDGLWGFEIENYLPNTTILIEYLNTSNAYDDPPYQADFYYWNYQYRTGWRYKNNSIGNPFVNPKNRLESIQLVHLGISGSLSDATYYKALLSKTQSRSLLVLNSTAYEVISVSEKIDVPSPTEFKILVGRKISENLDFNFFIVGNSRKHALGLNATYTIN